MPSYGFLGALGGGAKSVSDQMLMKMEEDKATRLEEVRGGINRETNRQNNEQRNEHSISQQAQRNSDAIDLQNSGNEQSLARMKLEENQTIDAEDREIANAETFTSEYDKNGKRIGQTSDRSGKWTKAGESSNYRGNTQAPSDIRSIDALVEKYGMKSEEAIELVMSRGSKSDEEWRRELAVKFSDGINSPDEVMEQVNAIMETSKVSGAPAPATGSDDYGMVYENLKHNLKAGGGKYTPEQLNEYISSKYGLTPNG